MVNMAGSCSSWFDLGYRNPPYFENGELQCKDFLSFSQQCWESVATSVLALLALLYAYPRLKLPETCPCSKLDPTHKRILLLLLCLTFGIELGVNLASRRMFWIGKPGHLATMLQIFILAAPPSRIVTAAFRLQMHMLIGIPLAICFPFANMHLSLFETGINCIHNTLLLGITFYLMHIGDPYIPESLGDFSWAMITYVILFLYHFLPLQLLAYVSGVNVNSILYPDAYCGNQCRFCRLLVFCHQIILIPILGKLLVIIAKTFMIFPCDNSLDESTTVCESSHPCKHSFCCSVDAYKHGSVSGSGDECNTDEDSGCVHSWNMVSKGCRRCSSKSPHGACCTSSYRPSCHRFCPRRSCLNDHKGFDWCCSPESVHTKRIVNGKLVDRVKIDEAPCKRQGEDKSSNMQKKAPAGRSSRSSVCRGFVLDDSLDSSPEAPVERTAPASDHDASRNSYAQVY